MRSYNETDYHAVIFFFGRIDVVILAFAETSLAHVNRFRCIYSAQQFYQFICVDVSIVVQSNKPVKSKAKTKLAGLKTK